VAAARKSRERKKDGRLFLTAGTSDDLLFKHQAPLTNYDITLDEFLGADLPAAHLVSAIAQSSSSSVARALKRNDDGESAALSLLRRKACAD
jgi:hypothetical protein